MRVVVMAAAVVMAACQSTPVTRYAVETWTTALTCLGGAIGPGGPPLTLHGSVVDDTARVWAAEAHGVLWPSGYYATFEPDLVVHDEAGTVRGREGDDMSATADDYGQTVCYTDGPTGWMGAPDSVLAVYPGSPG